MKRKTKKPRSQVRKAGRRKTKTSAIISLEEFYKLVNHVQISREEVVFSVSNDDIAMIENLLKDINLPFVKTDKKTYTKYNVSPGKERLIEDDTDEVIEEFPDEIAEDGQIFF